MKDLFTPPELVAHLGIGWIIVCAVALLVLFTVSAVFAQTKVYVGSAIAAGIAIIPEYKLLRAVAPSQTLLNVGLWAAFVLGAAGIAVLAGKLTDAYEVGWNGLIAGGLAAGATFLAALADKVNEHMAIIPLAPAVPVVAAIALVAYAFSSGKN